MKEFLIQCDPIVPPGEIWFTQGAGYKKRETWNDRELTIGIHETRRVIGKIVNLPRDSANQEYDTIL